MFDHSDGADAAELVSAYGFTLDPWQQTVLAAWLGRDADDRFTATSCGLAVPRQNGKNALIEARELYGIVTSGERILHTAHEVKTARKAFLRLASFFENERMYPELAALVKSIRKTNGQEAVELWAVDPETGAVLEGIDGGAVEFSARSRGAARGFTCDVVIFDEAQELTDEQMDALMPTLSAAAGGDPQMIFTGTPPGVRSPGSVFTRTRATALSEWDGSTAWHEWSVETMPRPDTPVGELVNLAYETNPAMGYRISESYVAKEAATLSPDGFARERLGWFAPVERIDKPISRKLWADAEIKRIGNGYTGITAFGAKFSPDGASVAVAGCKLGGKAKPGKAAVELVKLETTADGTKKLAEWIAQRKTSVSVVVVDGMNGADALCANVSDIGTPRGYLVRPRTSDIINATVSFMDGLKAGTLAHTPNPDLDKAATGCAKRAIGTRGGWGFGSDGSVAVETVEACALAYWGAKNTKRNPRRKQRML